MTAITLAHIVADELATLRLHPAETLPQQRPRRTVWSAQLPGFGVRHYESGKAIYIVQCLMQGITRTVTLGNTQVLGKREALDVARRVMLRAQLGDNPAGERKRKRKSPRFDDFLKLYWTRVAPGWKPSTQESQLQYRRKYLDNAFTGKFIDDIERADVLPWFNQVSDSGGPGAGNRCFEVLRALFNHAERWGYRAEGTNPCAFIKTNKRGKCERFLSDQEVVRLGEVLDIKRRTEPLHAIIIYLLLLTGCRRSEIVHLTWGEVKGNRLLLHDSKTGPRTVWLGDEARMLVSTLERRGPADPVFWSKLLRRTVKDIDRFWREVKADAGLPGVRLHDLRHSFASHAAARSETLPMIGRLLGHAKIASTARYAHLDDGHVLEAAERTGIVIAAAMGDSGVLPYNTMYDSEKLIQ